MNVSVSRDRWCLLLAFVYGLLVVQPLLFTEIAPSGNDAVADRVGDGPSARITRAVASLYYDDSFYYLQIARNLAGGKGSTFDGENPSNGYHPLWLLLLVPLAASLASPDHLLLASMVLQVLTAALTAAAVYRIARSGLSRLASALAVLVWIRIQLTYFMSWSGMEYGLQALASISLLLFYLRPTGTDTRARSGRWIALGLLASAAFLARIDHLLLAALVGLDLVRESAPGRRWRRAIGYGAPVALAVLGYLFLNLHHFGQALPLTAEIKGVWSQELLARDPRFLRGGYWGAKAAYLFWPLSHLSRSFAISLMLGSVAGLLLSWSPRLVGGPLARALRPWALFALLQYLAYALLYHGGFSYAPWYFVAQPLMSSLLAAALFDLLSRGAARKGARRWVAAVVLGALLASSALNLARRQDRQRSFGQEPLYVAAGWARAQLPAGQRIGAWNAGLVSFFSDLRVFNLDGLANSPEFFRTDRLELCDYLQREGIGYLVDVFDADEPFGLYRAQVGDCEPQLERVWMGAPPLRTPNRRAMAYRWRSTIGRAGSGQIP